jgi:hypothetical protein
LPGQEVGSGSFALLVYEQCFLIPPKKDRFLESRAECLGGLETLFSKGGFQDRFLDGNF